MSSFALQPETLAALVARVIAEGTSPLLVFALSRFAAIEDGRALQTCASVHLPTPSVEEAELLLDQDPSASLLLLYLRAVRDDRAGGRLFLASAAEVLLRSASRSDPPATRAPRALSAAWLIQASVQQGPDTSATSVDWLRSCTLALGHLATTVASTGSELLAHAASAVAELVVETAIWSARWELRSELLPVLARIVDVHPDPSAAAVYARRFAEADEAAVSAAAWHDVAQARDPHARERAFQLAREITAQIKRARAARPMSPIPATPLAASSGIPESRGKPMPRASG